MPGTAELTEQLTTLTNLLQGGATRQRAMMLSWVDEWERTLGYGEAENPPRTAQIRQYWRQIGEPRL